MTAKPGGLCASCRTQVARGRSGPRSWSRKKLQPTPPPGVNWRMASSAVVTRASKPNSGSERLDKLSDLGKFFPEAAGQSSGDESEEVPLDSQDIDEAELYALLKEGEEDGQNLYFSDEDALFGDLEEGEEIQEDEEIFNLSTGWSVEAFDAGSLGSLGRGFAPAASGDGEDEGDDEDLGMAANQLLRSVPDHIVRRLEIEQQEADKVNRELQVKKAGGGGGTKPKTQRRLRIIAGTASSIRIHSQVGDLTRPMMEKVRGAMFDALISRIGGNGMLPGTRWLDLFAGTGSVGIEGLSRGCQDAHFIELDPWVVSNVLEPNLELTGLASRAAVHQMKAEDFLARARTTPRFAGGAFDFISVCPPYLLVSYPELFQLLEGSPLVHEDTHIIVEYPKELSDEIPDTIGPLIKFRDRRYGRTLMAMYGPE